MVPTVHLCSGRMDGWNKLSKGVPIHCEGKGGKREDPKRKLPRTACCSFRMEKQRDMANLDPF